MKEDKSDEVIKKINFINQKEFKSEKSINELDSAIASPLIKSKTSRNLDRIDYGFDCPQSKKKRKELISDLQMDQIFKSNLSNEINVENCLKTGRWSQEEHFKFINAIFKYGNDWKKVQKCILSRNSTQSRSHAQKFFQRLRKKLNLNSKNDCSLEYINKLPKEFLISSIRNCTYSKISLNKVELERLLKVFVNFNSKTKSKHSFDNVSKIDSLHDSIMNNEKFENSDHYCLTKKKYFNIDKIYKPRSKEVYGNIFPFSNIIELNPIVDHNLGKKANFELLNININQFLHTSFKKNEAIIAPIMPIQEIKDEGLDNADKNKIKLINFLQINVNRKSIIKRIRKSLKTNPKIFYCLNKKNINEQNGDVSKILYPELYEKLKTQYRSNNIINLPNQIFNNSNSSFNLTTCTNDLLVNFIKSTTMNQNCKASINQSDYHYNNVKNHTKKMSQNMKNMTANGIKNVDNFQQCEANNQMNIEKEDASKFNDFPMSILKPISKTSINLTDNYRENFFLDEVFLNDNLSILYHLISF